MSKKPLQLKPSQQREVFQALGLVSHIGITMAVCVIAGVLLGRFLDGLLHTSPWMILVFSILGVAAAFKSLYDLAVKAERRKPPPGPPNPNGSGTKTAEKNPPHKK